MYQIPNGIKITNAQEKSIRKLSSYLLNLPENYAHFDMRMYCEAIDGGGFNNEVEPCGALEILSATCNTGVCGTAGCALGHGPVAGIKTQKTESWEEYSERAFGLEADYFDHSCHWAWCFNGNWANKTSDAALRLQYILDYGVPKLFRGPSSHWTGKVRKAYDIV